MAEYKVVKVSEQPPKEYESPNGLIYYIKVMVDGHDKPITVGKKTPDAIKTGDVLTGTITPTEYSEDKFKSEKPFNAGFKGQPKDEAAIKAMWSISQAVALHTAVTSNGGEEAQSIEATAKELFAMVDRVKVSDGQAQDSNKF